VATTAEVVVELALGANDDTAGLADLETTFLEAFDSLLMSRAAEVCDSRLGGVEKDVAVMAPRAVCLLVSGVLLLVIPPFGDAVGFAEDPVLKRLPLATEPGRLLVGARFHAVFVTARHCREKRTRELEVIPINTKV